MNFHNKLECLPLASFTIQAALSGRLLAFLTNIRLGWKSLPGTKTLAYF